jgi:hypothetical protein
MNAAHDSTTPSTGNLPTAWGQGRRQVTPWAYPHLRSLGITRLTIGVPLMGVAAWLISRGDGFAVIPMAASVLLIAIGSLDLIARRASRSRT